MELCRLRPDDLPNHFSRNTQIAADRLDRHLSRKIRQTNFGDRLHNQHLGLGPLRDQEACVDPYPRGPDWMPITPKTGSLFHAESQTDCGTAVSFPGVRQPRNLPLASLGDLFKGREKMLEE